MSTSLDPGDTSRCPTGDACEGCGFGAALTVEIAHALGSALCLTLCDECVTLPLPSLAPLAAMTRAGQHAEHLGCDVDELAAAVAGGAR